MKKKKKNLKTKIPIVVKISPDIRRKEIDEISEVLLIKMIEGVIISNTSDSSRENLKISKNIKKGGCQANQFKQNQLF